MGYMHRAFSPGEGNGRIIRGNDGETVILGYDPEDGILVPRPGRTMPKPGHWRTTPNARIRIQGLKTVNIRDNALMSGRTDGDYVADEGRRKESRKARRLRYLAALRELGYA